MNIMASSQRKIIILAMIFSLTSCKNFLFTNDNNDRKNPEPEIPNFKSPEPSFTKLLPSVKPSATAFPSPAGITTVNNLPAPVNSSNDCPKPNPDKIEPFPGFYSNENALKLKGQVFDKKGNFINGVEVHARTEISDPNRWEGKIITQNNGAYIFKDAPTGIILIVEANGSGYIGKKRIEIIKTGIVCNNIYNFGGNDFPDDQKYALEPNVQ